MKTSDIFVEYLDNKKLLLAAFYQLTYQVKYIIALKIIIGDGIKISVQLYLSHLIECISDKNWRNVTFKELTENLMLPRCRTAIVA